MNKREAKYRMGSSESRPVGASSIAPRLKSDWTSAEPDPTLPPDEFASQGSSTNQTILVEARHLRKSYGNHLAVKDVSFSIRSGEVLGLLGPNGAGKSTSMLMLTGLLTPSSGDVFLNGQKFDGWNLDQRRLFGIVPQEYAIYEQLSAVANLMFFGRLYGLRSKRLKIRCDEVLDQIGLTESARRPAGTYSGGMKRRLNFGIALMHKPAILVLDEPTLGVDPQSRTHLMDCIHQQTAEGGCVVYASHYMEEAQSICQRVVIVDHGEVIANDSIHHLLAGLASDVYLYVDRTTGIANELGDLARVGTGSNEEPVVIVSGNVPRNIDRPRQVRSSTDRDAIQMDNPQQNSNIAGRLQSTLDKLKDLGILVLSVETQQSNLEGLFLKLTGKRLRD